MTETIDWETYKEKGNEEFKRKNYDAAINHYTDGIMCEKGQEVLYANRAQCYIFQRRYKLAKIDLNKCLEINPKSIKALKRHCQIHLNLGELEEAKAYQQRCVGFEPKDYSHQSELQTINFLIMKTEEMNKNFANKDYKVAENMARELLEKCPEALRLKRIIIESLLNQNKLPEVMSYITTKITKEEMNSSDDFNYFLALAFYYEGNYAKGKQIMNIVYRRNEENEKYKKLYDILQVIEGEKEKANEIFKKGDYENAIESYTKLLNIDPDNKVFNSVIISNRALCYQKLGKRMEALSDMNTAISLNDNYAKGYTRRANIHFELGNFEDARYDYEKVKTLEPDNKDARKRIEECKKKEKDAKKKDYYKILGLSNDASADQIKKAYRKLAPKYHPDKNSSGTEEEKKLAEKMFKDVTEAYQVLSDPQKKAMFDNGTDPNDPSGGADFGGSTMDASEIFKVFFGGGGGFGGFGGAGGPEIRFNMSGGGGDFGGFGGFGGSSSRGNRGKGGFNPFG